ncbi:amidohydrolase [Glaciihabitans sp. dw_435]|uniref:amidohydrolase n=1 Tax=Glaciihabitans sp. dw_435 TaxID=2720081 RepID=UPI001BD66F6F|nr:amidohydrolase [Glaciihabitans sp. dw_435]
MLLRNVRFAGDPAAIAMDVLIVDGTIVAMGESGTLEHPGAAAVASTSPGTAATPDDAAAPTEVDLQGRWLIPGLWDNHVHFSQWTLGSQRLDISTAESAADAAAAVAAALELSTVPRDVTIPFVAVGFRDGLWADAPNRIDLDAASGGFPVVLVSGDLHAVWLNSAALELYGHGDHPTGLLREDEAFEITRRIDSVPEALLDEWAIAAGRQAASRGVVGIVDLEMTWSLGTWTRRRAAGFDSLRVNFGIYSEHLDRAIAEGLHTGQQIDELISVGPFKVLTDGSLNTRTAYCYDEYPGREGQEGSHGMLVVAPEQLVPLMRRAWDAGIVPAVHAIGDHANTVALDAFEEVGCHGVIEHAQLLSDADLPRFEKLGVIASVQPDHAMDDRDVAERHWAGRTGHSFPLRSLLDSGATIRLGSDAPVSPLDPWVSISAAVTRTRGGRQPWHPEQSISLGEALSASTRSSIRVGQPADLVVLDADPFAAPGEKLSTMPVVATLLGGRFTYNALP